MRTADLFELAQLVQSRDLNKAAQALSISPDVMARHIKRLERELSVPLVTHTSEGTELTVYGDMLLPYAHQILNLESACLEKVTDPIENKYTLCIGYSHSITQHPIQDYLFQFQRESTFVDSFIFADISPNLNQKVLSGDCDIAFLFADPTSERPTVLNNLPVSVNQLAFVLPASHPLTRFGQLQFWQLKEEKLLLTPENSPIYSISMAKCLEAGFRPNVIFTSPNIHDIIDLASKERGIGVIPAVPLSAHTNPHVTFVRSATPDLLSTELIYRKDNLSPALFYFLTSVASQID